MSGHSKWATTKHKKAVIDARRGKMFAKLIKNIEVAARMGGGDMAGNPTLYDAVQKAKKSSVPNDNIDRAVKRGSGAEAGGADYTTIMYEGYGPNGVAFLIECLTDNKNRAAMEVRTAMNRNGGSLADPGSVSYMFQRKGVVIVPQEQDGKQVSEDDVLEATLDAGAEDVNDLGDSFEVISEPGDLIAVRSALQDAGLGARAALDGAVDVLVRDRGLLGLLDGVVEGRVARRVSPAHPGRDLDVLDELGEHLAAPRVDDGLLVLGRRPFGVARHEVVPLLPLLVRIAAAVRRASRRRDS